MGADKVKRGVLKFSPLSVAFSLSHTHTLTHSGRLFLLNVFISDVFQHYL